MADVSSLPTDLLAAAAISPAVLMSNV